MDIKGYRKVKEYRFYINERRVTFEEIIKIDEEKDVEYFYVLVYNEVIDVVDYLYDFKRVSL